MRKNTVQGPCATIGVGKIFFPLGSKNRFKKQSGQSNSNYNFMQYAFFSKKAYNLWCTIIQSEAKPSEAGRVFENFCVKRLLLTVSYRKNG